MQVLLLFPGDIIDDVALVHHDQAVAVLDGILHVVGDHHGGQAVLLSAKIVEENHLTTMMITHNMKDAIKYGNRLIMMYEIGRAHV